MFEAKQKPIICGRWESRRSSSIIFAFYWQLFSGLLLLAFSFSANSFAFDAQPFNSDLSGSHRGLVQGPHDKIRADLILHSLNDQGRSGSYLALLIVSDDSLKVATYLVDPLDQPNHFSMVPREITADGQIVGVNNPDPSLEMITNGNQMTVVDAHSSNTDFFQGSIIFDSKDKSDFTWLDYQPGVYKVNDYKISVTGAVENGQSQLLLTLPSNLSGNFILRSGAPSLYTLKAVSSTSVGDELEQYPRRIGIFLQKGHEVDFLLVDPLAYNNVLKLKQTAKVGP